MNKLPTYYVIIRFVRLLGLENKELYLKIEKEKTEFPSLFPYTKHTTDLFHATLFKTKEEAEKVLNFISTVDQFFCFYSIKSVLCNEKTAENKIWGS